LSLGEAVLTAGKMDGAWNFTLNLSVSIPGFPLSDKYQSTVTATDLCSTELSREMRHGARKATEKPPSDQKNGTAPRRTMVPAGGGQSELSFHGCGRDAVAF